MTEFVYVPVHGHGTKHHHTVLISLLYTQDTRHWVDTQALLVLIIETIQS